MKKNLLISSVVLTAVIAIGINHSAMTNSTGISARTGAPGETTCNACHTGNTVNDPSGSIQIATVPVMTNGQYVPGTTYSVALTITKPGQAKFGLCIVSLNSSNANAGSIIVTNTNETQILTSGGKNYLTHRNGGAVATDTKTFTFDWVAPAAGTGTVNVYYAGNATNNNGNTSGDFIYNNSVTLTELTTSIESLSRENLPAISLYPSPAAEQFNVEFANVPSQQTQIELFDINGKRIAELFNDQLSSSRLTFNRPAGLSAGVYFIRITNQEKQTTQKIYFQ
jgi:hypothetical protein